VGGEIFAEVPTEFAETFNATGGQDGCLQEYRLAASGTDRRAGIKAAMMKPETAMLTTNTVRVGDGSPPGWD
jgi:hypothetical protein